MKTQTFGTEIETTGLGRQRTAEVIAKFFGTTAQYIGAHLDDWKIPMDMDSVYRIVRGEDVPCSRWNND